MTGSWSRLLCFLTSHSPWVCGSLTNPQQSGHSMPPSPHKEHVPSDVHGASVWEKAASSGEQRPNFCCALLLKSLVSSSTPSLTHKLRTRRRRLLQTAPRLAQLLLLCTLMTVKYLRPSTTSLLSRSFTTTPSNAHSSRTLCQEEQGFSFDVRLERVLVEEHGTAMSKSHVEPVREARIFNKSGALLKGRRCATVLQHGLPRLPGLARGGPGFHGRI